MPPTHPELSNGFANSHRYRTVALSAILCLGVLFGTYVLTDRRAQIEIGKSSAEQLAAHSSLLASGTLDTSRQLLRSLALLAAPPVKPGGLDPAAVVRKLRQLQAGNPQVMDLLIVSPQGKISYWTGPGTPPDISHRDYFLHHADRPTSGLYLGEPLVSIVHPGRWFFSLSEAMRDENGQLQQVLVVIIDVAVLRDLLAAPLAIPGSTQALLSESGTVYARLPDHALHVGKKISRPHELEPLSPSNPSATIISRSQLDRKERILSFRRLPNYPVTAVGTVMLDELLAEWQQRTLLLGALWLLLSGGIVWIARRENAISLVQQEQANIDALTGIRNRRAILSSATTLERSQHHTGSLSLLMIDIDHFKEVNDRFGHLVGDEVLRQVSSVLRLNIRTTDILGRYGGEEFLVLMPDTGPAGALLVAETLRQAIAAKVIQPCPVTISVGVATTSENDATLDRTLSRADKALYAAKAAGRNCIRVAAGGDASPAD